MTNNYESFARLELSNRMREKEDRTEFDLWRVLKYRTKTNLLKYTRASDVVTFAELKTELQ